ncbi:phospholipid/cholesterol/gamma-HCH transport system ATP-binding protein [Chitinophaga jiangningensis]|uniref:Phospholipid/cholesterol/gamma-HCH transport system ATP-binding protein n=1 Tax=Chitinophaga jiangningensis TaxID=1419482 RepID=A0A1M6ZVN7_9BACT|nr:ABC transporter ATP-binding protein [Chitinophaga jiangningensis]SHL34469.1 phospholipid/cholesterol/gamma-HCH transport system ATP-binding protein [Chitinophaga jiangningensis]
MKNFKPNIDWQDKVIDIKDLFKSFGSNHVLRGISLEVHKGENVVVLGRSGTGKSVLIKIMVGLLSPDSGEVNVLGKEVPTLSVQELRELRLRVGFCFQNGALYDSMTVGENLAFPLKRNTPGISRAKVKEMVANVLDAVGLSQTLDQMPSELSGGQRKRIGIARTLILRPDIMLYDEPTAGLDPITCTEINNLINEVQQRFNTTSIIITHDLTCAKAVGDTIVVMKEGKFIKRGPFDEVFDSNDELIREFYDYNFIQ